MPEKKNKYFILLCLFLAQVFLYAQEPEWNKGYVVLTNNDTLHGLTRKRGFNHCRILEFKKDAVAEEIKFTSEDAKFYTWGSERYKLVFVPTIGTKYGDYMFGEIIEEGNIVLYGFQNDPTGYKIMGIELPGENYVKMYKKNVLNKKIVCFKELSDILNKHKDLSLRMKNNEFMYTQFPEVISEYNKWMSKN